MDSLNTDIDLEISNVYSELTIINQELSELENKAAILSDIMRLKRIRKYDLEYRLKELKREKELMKKE